MNLLNLPQEFLLPDYDGGSIANVPATVAALMNVKMEGLPPLRPSLWQPLAGDVQRVVVLVIDACGWHLLVREWERLRFFLERTAVTEQITSIFPSTTVAALSSLWTGVAPAQHGLVGLKLLLPDYSTVAQMLSFAPAFGGQRDALVDAGLNPKEFLQARGFARQLAATGIPTHVYKGRDIVDSVLSKMHGRGVATDNGISTFAEMMVGIRQQLEATPGQALYINGYWPMIDKLSHVYGWQHPAVAAELRACFEQIVTELLKPLSPAARSGTALFVMADHGQTTSASATHVWLHDHPQLQQMLLMLPAGEPRVSYLYTRRGCRDQVIAYINERLGELLLALPAEEVLASGLLGPPPPAAVTAERLGDVVVMARGDALLLSRQDEAWMERLYGRHGSLTPQEMAVPWLGMRLDRS